MVTCYGVTLSTRYIIIIIMSVFAVALTIGCVWMLTSHVDAQCFSSRDDVRSSMSVEGMLNGSTNFGLRLFDHLALLAQESESNVVISPFSVWMALLMAYIGAKGSTEKELSLVLGLQNASKADVGRAYKALKYWYVLRGSRQENYTLDLANGLFVDQSVLLRPCIIKYFPEEIHRVDFTRAPEASRVAMNAWVEKQTRHRIQDMFPRGSVDGSISFALINAAYFKGKWESAFPKEATRKERFFVTKEHHVLVDMMHQTGSFYYGVSDHLGYQALEIQFTGEEISMIFLLPKEGITVDALSRRLSSDNLRTIRRLMWQRDINVAIPKFRLEYSVDLVQTLGGLGLKALFQRHVANLSGFSEQTNLNVGSVRHKAFLDVNEEGSEAAASTSLLIWRSARPAFPPNFTVNRPFIVIIHDNLSNAVLFMGAVNRPESPNEV